MNFHNPIGSSMNDRPHSTKKNTYKTATILKVDGKGKN